MKLTLLIGFLLLFSGVLEAQPKKGKSTSKSRIVDVNFDDELLIRGKLLGPSLFTLYQKRNVEFGKLIKPRENFLPEMRASMVDIE